MRSRLPPALLCGTIYLAAALVYFAVRVKYLGFRELYPWDTGWYNSITRWGYLFDGSYTKEQNVAFFPLHPWLVSVVGTVTRLPVWIAQILVSTALTATAGALLAHVMSRTLAARHVALASFLIAFSPFAIFLYNGYSESAYFLASVVLLYALGERPRLGLAVLAAIAASIARPWGIVLATVAATCLVARWWERPGERTLSPNRIVFVTSAAALGFIGITVYFQIAYADPLVFMHAASVWTTAPTTSFRWGALTGEGIGFALGKFRESAFQSMAVGATLYLAAIVTWALARRWLSRELSWYFAVHAAAFYALTYWSTHGVLNSGRYAMLLFPAAFYAVVIFQRIDEALRPPWLGASDTSGTARGLLFADRSLPALGYVTAAAFVALYLRYASDFVGNRWVS